MPPTWRRGLRLSPMTSLHPMYRWNTEYTNDLDYTTKTALIRMRCICRKIFGSM